MQTISFVQFEKQFAEKKLTDHVVVVPDRTTQATLEELNPLARVIRRDEWLDPEGEKKFKPLLAIQERHAFVQSTALTLNQQKLLHCPRETYLTLSFTNRLFEFFDEVISAGVWSEQAWEKFFLRLPDNPLTKDLALFCKILWSQRNHFLYPPDSLRVLKIMESQERSSPPHAFVGFHRMSFLELEALRVRSRIQEMVLVRQEPPIHQRPILPVHRFKHYLEECHWIGNFIEKTISTSKNRRPLRLGVIVPPHPAYALEFIARFALPEPGHEAEEIYSWLQGLILSWNWIRHQDARRNPAGQWSDHPLSLDILKTSQKSSILEEMIRRPNTLKELFEKTASLLGKCLHSTPTLLEAYELLLKISEHWKSADIYEDPQFWITILDDARILERKRLPLGLSEHGSELQLIDYRCAKLSKCDIHFAPGLNDRVYPPRLVEHPFLGESIRHSLSKGVEALPLLTQEERLKEEKLFFQHNLAPLGRRSVLSASDETPVGADAPLSPYFTDCGLKVRTVKHFKVVSFSFNRTPDPQWSKVSKQLQSPVAQKIQHLTPTQLENYRKCPFQFFLKSVAKIRKEDEQERLTPLLRGTIVHRWLKEIFEKDIDPNNFEAFAALCNEEYPPEYLESPEYVALTTHYLYRLWKDPVSRERERFKTSRRALVACEYEFKNFPIAENLVLNGAIDRIDQTPEGFVVVDYKTGHKDVTKADRAGQGKILQPFVYSAAAAAHYKTPVVRAEFIYLTNEKALEEFQPLDLFNLIREDVAQLSQGNFPPKPFSKSMCDQCEFTTACPVGANR